MPNKVCSPLDYFKSFYYKNTYLNSIDLEREIPKHCLKEAHAELKANVEALISTDEVKKVLSKPAKYDQTSINKNKNTLEKNGYTLLNKTGTVLKHNDLPGWIIKSGSERFKKEIKVLIGPNNSYNETALATQEESLLRIFMRKRIKKVAEKLNIDLVLPRKKFVQYSNANENEKPAKKYCIIAEELNVLSADDTANRIRNMDQAQQLKLAKDICKLIKKAGFVDSYLQNIRLTDDNKLAIIDTEPFGLMRDSHNKERAFTHSVEKCARIGLERLHLSSFVQVDKKMRNTPSFFTKEILRQKQKADNNLYSSRKITISVLFPPLPIAIFIISCLRYIQIKYYYYRSEPEVPFDLEWTRNQTQSRYYLNRIYTLIEGVRFGENNPIKPFLV